MTPKSVQNFAIESIKEGVDGWKQFEEKFPELATNIGSSFELAGVIPAGKAGQVGGKVIKKGAEKVLEELTAAGERLATSQAKRAEERVIGKVGADTIE